ncbi:MAG: amino acid ABC transporter permease [Clostridiales bacterium]|jgi:putative glutamine transport system permease protein|nr:amino acid ABC transporter permease [Clostridiales bacterium]
MLSQVIADVFTPANIQYLIIGLIITLGIAVCTVLLSVLIGSVLAICRNYEKIILGKIAGVYIEIFRNTPLLLWILVCVFTIRGGNPLLRGSLALVLYTSSVIAEIVRGGLNAIPKGQFEAANSQGFRFHQTIFYIVLPQCFHKIVPSLMSQIVTTIKDTSFLSQFAIMEFFYRSRIIMSSLSQSVTVTSLHVFVIFLFVALVYFVINFTLSSFVHGMQKKALTSY